ncbi:MAG: 50S ribosomal protein L5 [Armatimonadetes bacterium]|nr:50S ribosomal protein L5 [Armatimonadota bacterium]
MPSEKKTGGQKPAAPKGGEKKAGAAKGGEIRGGEQAPVASPKTPPRLKTHYQQQAVPAMQKEFGYKNVMQVPRLEKVVINMGVGAAGQTGGDPKILDGAVSDLMTITGQRPAITRAKKSIANFRLREGQRIGAKVTLRGPRMYEFLDRLFNIALPRVRDFGGINPNSFDGRGNFAMGLKEQLTFPEIVYDRVDRVRGMDIIIVTTAKSDAEARSLLKNMGLPFRGDRPGERAQ